MSEKSLLLLGDKIIKIRETKCGAHVAASMRHITSIYRHGCAFLDACLAHSVYCVMSAVLDVCGSVGQECNGGVSRLQELQQKLRETIVLLMQHEQAYDLAEAWAVRIADEFTAHKQAIQQVEDAKLRLSAPTSNTAAASLSKREQHLTQLRRRFGRVSAETWSTVFRFFLCVM